MRGTTTPPKDEKGCDKCNPNFQNLTLGFMGVIDLESDFKKGEG